MRYQFVVAAGLLSAVAAGRRRVHRGGSVSAREERPAGGRDRWAPTRFPSMSSCPSSGRRRTGRACSRDEPTRRRLERARSPGHHQAHRPGRDRHGPRRGPGDPEAGRGHLTGDPAGGAVREADEGRQARSGGRRQGLQGPGQGVEDDVAALQRQGGGRARAKGNRRRCGVRRRRRAGGGRQGGQDGGDDAVSRQERLPPPDPGGPRFAAGGAGQPGHPDPRRVRRLAGGGRALSAERGGAGGRTEAGPDPTAGSPAQGPGAGPQTAVRHDAQGRPRRPQLRGAETRPRGPAEGQAGRSWTSRAGRRSPSAT